MTALDQNAAPAIVPGRVLILNEHEQRKLARAMDWLAKGDDEEALRLHHKITQGDAYVNEVDEAVRLSLRKKILESAAQQAGRRITALSETIIEDLVERGESSVRHAATGANLRIDSTVWARLDVDIDEDTPKTVADAIKAEAKGPAGDALIAAGLGEYVRSDFNLNSVSAYFREQIKAYRQEQALLPEHERVPREASSFLPPELDGFLKLDETPKIVVTKN